MAEVGWMNAGASRGIPLDVGSCYVLLLCGRHVIVLLQQQALRREEAREVDSVKPCEALSVFATRTACGWSPVRLLRGCSIFPPFHVAGNLPYGQLLCKACLRIVVAVAAMIHDGRGCPDPLPDAPIHGKSEANRGQYIG